VTRATVDKSQPLGSTTTPDRKNKKPLGSTTTPPEKIRRPPPAPLATQRKQPAGPAEATGSAEGRFRIGWSTWRQRTPRSYVANLAQADEAKGSQHREINRRGASFDEGSSSQKMQTWFLNKRKSTKE